MNKLLAIPILFFATLASGAVPPDTQTTGEMSLLRPATGQIDKKRHLVDKFNVNFEIIDSTVTDIINKQSKGTIIFNDEGTSLGGKATSVDCVGAGINCTQSGSSVTLNITATGGGGGGGGGSIYDGSSSVAFSTLSFPGATITSDASASTVTYMPVILTTWTALTAFDLSVTTGITTGEWIFTSSVTAYGGLATTGTVIGGVSDVNNPAFSIGASTCSECIFRVASGQMGIGLDGGERFRFTNGNFFPVGTQDLGLTDSFPFEGAYIQFISMLNSETGGSPYSSWILQTSNSSLPDGNYSMIQQDIDRNQSGYLQSNGTFIDSTGDKTILLHLNQDALANDSQGLVSGVHCSSCSGAVFQVDGASAAAIKIYGSENNTQALFEIRMDETPFGGVDQTSNYLGSPAIFTKKGSTIANITNDGGFVTISSVSTYGNISTSGTIIGGVGDVNNPSFSIHVSSCSECLFRPASGQLGLGLDGSERYRFTNGGILPIGDQDLGVTAAFPFRTAYLRELQVNGPGVINSSLTARGVIISTTGSLLGGATIQKMLTVEESIRLTTLTNENCIGTDSNGVFQSGTCEGGEGGGGGFTFDGTDHVVFSTFTIPGVQVFTGSNKVSTFSLTTSTLTWTSAQTFSSTTFTSTMTLFAPFIMGTSDYSSFDTQSNSANGVYLTANQATNNNSFASPSLKFLTTADTNLGPTISLLVSSFTLRMHASGAPPNNKSQNLAIYNPSNQKQFIFGHNGFFINNNTIGGSESDLFRIGTTSMIVTREGNVSLGTIMPISRFHVKGGTFTLENATFTWNGQHFVNVATQTWASGDHWGVVRVNDGKVYWGKVGDASGGVGGGSSDNLGSHTSTETLTIPYPYGITATTGLYTSSISINYPFATGVSDSGLLIIRSTHADETILRILSSGTFSGNPRTVMRVLQDASGNGLLDIGARDGNVGVRLLADGDESLANDSFIRYGEFALGGTDATSKFDLINGSITVRGTDVGIRVNSLTDCDTIDTDAHGNFVCGTDAGGAGGGGTGSSSYDGTVVTQFSTMSIIDPFGNVATVANSVQQSSFTILGATLPTVQVPIPAGSWRGIGTNEANEDNSGFAVSSSPLAYDQVPFDFTEFKDGSTRVFSAMQFTMPLGWFPSTAAFQFDWYAASGAANSNCVFCMDALSISSGTTLGGVVGSSVCVTTTYNAVHQVEKSPRSPGLTIGGNPSPGDTVYFRFFRDGGDGLDDLDAFVNMLNVDIFYRRQKFSDE